MEVNLEINSTLLPIYLLGNLSSEQAGHNPVEHYLVIIISGYNSSFSIIWVNIGPKVSSNSCR